MPMTLNISYITVRAIYKTICMFNKMGDFKLKFKIKSPQKLHRNPSTKYTLISNIYTRR